MGNLEEFVRKHRHQMDEKRPDKLKMWSEIERGLAPSATVRPLQSRRMIWRIAAGFILLCLVGALLLNQNRSTMLIAQEQEELVDINQYYTQLINYKIDQIKSSSKLSESDKVEFLEYFEELESECRELESDFKQQIDNETVLRAIVDNYRKRLNLLENLLARLDQSKEKEDEESISL